MKQMTSRQRLLAAARRQPVDLIPLAPRVGHAAHYHCGSQTPQNMLRLKKIYDYDPFITICGQDIPLANPFEVFTYAPGVDVDIKIKDQSPKRFVAARSTLRMVICTKFWRFPTPAIKNTAMHLSLFVSSTWSKVLMTCPGSDISSLR